MQRLQAGSITVADIERIARIDAEEVVLAAAKAKCKIKCTACTNRIKRKSHVKRSSF